uniref:Uncharacterized protein n=1 Tax=Rhizobium phage IG49 TaxID=3129228 RepID=A0AAU8HZF6_9CAUD
MTNGKFLPLVKMRIEKVVIASSFQDQASMS